MAERKRGRAPPPSSGRARVDWLARALARAGVMPAEEAEDAILAGRVTIAGRVVKQPLTMLKPGDLEKIKVDGHPIALEMRTRVLMMNKPPDHVTAERDRHARTVYELLRDTLPQELTRYQWHAVGRLDRNTTGILLFTNDEKFVAHATSPEMDLPKRYVAQLGADASEGRVDVLRRGIELDDGMTRPAKVKLRSKRELELVLTEGRNHQAKRMLGAVGLPVLKLHREAIGELELDIPEGCWREVTEAELREKLRFEPR